MKVLAVKEPSFGNRRKRNVRSITVLTVRTIISEERGCKLENTASITTMLLTTQFVIADGPE